MGLIDDQGVVGIQERVALGLGQQNTIGHEFDGGLGSQLIVEPHLKAHHIAQRRAKLFGNALGNRRGRDASRLCVPNQTRLAALCCIHSPTPQGQGHFGQLSGFARSCFARDNHHLVRLNGLHDLFSSHADGQRGREFDFERSVCQKKAKISSQSSIISVASPKSKVPMS